jgi:hypothetical protein
MRNPEMLELAYMAARPEYGIEGKRVMYVTFDIHLPVLDRQPVNHGTQRPHIVANPSVPNCGHQYHCCHDFHWFLNKEAHQWTIDTGAKYELYWSEDHTIITGFRGPRYYRLRIVFEEPAHGILFKLTFGGDICQAA